MESDDVEGAITELLEYLPSHTDEIPPVETIVDPVGRLTPELVEVIPERKAATYDVRDVIRAVTDEGQSTESSGRVGPARS